jgi:hypothetical protein
MSGTLMSAAIIGKAVAPIIKDIYEGAKGEARKALTAWSATGFPKKLARQISQIDAVRTIWSPDENVSLREFYYPCKILNREFEEVPIRSVADLGEGSVVIQGSVGQGKSILIRYLAIQELTSGKSKRIPIFLELRRITKNNSLIELVKNTLSVYGVDVNDSVFSYLASTGRITLLLDGFDEIGSEFAIGAAADIETLVCRYPELQIVVTSRPGNEVQKLSVLTVVEICSLESEDYAPFLKALKITPSKIVELVDAISESPSDISDLITTPLMLTLVVFVYKSEKKIPAELPEFFEKLFYTVFTRHDKLKPLFEREHNSGLSERKLQLLFEAFCFMSMQMGCGRTLNSEQFSEAFEFTQNYVDNAKCDENGFKKDITKVACLMLEEGLGDLTFIHKSIAEYHAAAFVKSSDDEFAKRFYTESAKDWAEWRETLRFLESIDPFRYAKYFGIPGLSDALPFYELLVSCDSSKELISKLPSWMKRVSLKYRPDEDGRNYVFFALGSWSRPEGFYHAELSNVLSSFAFKNCPHDLTAEQISEIRDAGIVVESSSFEEEAILLADAIFLWAEDSYHSAMLAQVESVKARLSKAEALAEKLITKVRIFDKKPR